MEKKREIKETKKEKAVNKFGYYEERYKVSFIHVSRLITHTYCSQTMAKLSFCVVSFDEGKGVYLNAGLWYGARSERM